MKRSVIALLAALLTLAACSGKTDADKMKAVQKSAPAKPAVRLTLVPQGELSPGKKLAVLAKLNNIQERTVITPDLLETVHTKNFHLLVIDPTFTDYQHIHPQPTAIPGIYSFSFTPHLPGGYRAWADVTPKFTGRQEYAMADLGHPRGGHVDKTEKHEAMVNGYRFVLSFDKPPAQGGESMGTITITDAGGAPVKTLEPVMGAYAHIVGFYDDFRTVAHMHPVGPEPASAASRGGPELMFHLMPEKAGFIKLFAQVKIKGRELYAPFGVNVKK